MSNYWLPHLSPVVFPGESNFLSFIIIILIVKTLKVDHVCSVHVRHDKHIVTINPKAEVKSKCDSLFYSGLPIITE